MKILRLDAEQFRRQLRKLLGRVGYGRDQAIVGIHFTWPPLFTQVHIHW